MITMTEFIEKVDAIMGQQMDDTKANQLCRLYAMIYDRGKNSGHNICVAKAREWLEKKAYLYVWENCEQGEHGIHKTMLEDFRKAMEGK